MASQQAQITAGHPIYIQPVPPTAKFVEVIDFRATIPQTLITVTLTKEDVAGAVAEMLEEADGTAIEEVFTDGLAYVLDQPEFAGGTALRPVLEVLQRADFLEQLLPVVTRRGGVHVIIGRENPNDAMREVSLIFAPYGTPDRALGLLGVLGPTRMAYPQAIGTVRFVSGLMNELIDHLYA